MGKKESMAFKWNKPAPATLVLPAPPQQPEPVQPEGVVVGKEVVELSSLLRKLLGAYLSTDQRADLAKDLRERFLRLQKMASRIADSEIRQRLTAYLVVMSSLGVFAEGDESGVYTLLEAIASSDVLVWVTHFYSAAHDILERDVDGHHLRYSMTKELIDREQHLCEELLLWLESAD